MRDGNSETETELQAAERRISKIQRCGAARVASMEQSFLGLLEAIGEDPQREGLVRTPGRAARAFEFLTAGYRQSSVMKTSCLLGVFKDDARTRSEFLSLLND